MADFDQFVKRYESERFSRNTHWLYLVNSAFAELLYSLRSYEIVFICDDSGSMSVRIDKS
jgi:hypothetical protein